jgi:hypothetical protein
MKQPTILMIFGALVKPEYQTFPSTLTPALRR